MGYDGQHDPMAQRQGNGATGYAIRSMAPPASPPSSLIQEETARHENLLNELHGSIDYLTKCVESALGPEAPTATGSQGNPGSPAGTSALHQRALGIGRGIALATERLRVLASRLEL